MTANDLPHAQPAVDLAATTAEAVRQLNHLTLVPRALTGPAELDRIVAELATMACLLPQLLRQLSSWLDAEQHARRLRPDNSTDPARIVARATAELADASHAAQELGRTLDGAHRHLAHLGARSATGAATSRPGPPARTDRAETVATSGQFHGHQRAGFVSARGQIQMSLDTLTPLSGKDRYGRAVLGSGCTEARDGHGRGGSGSGRVPVGDRRQVVPGGSWRARAVGRPGARRLRGVGELRPRRARRSSYLVTQVLLPR